MGCRVTNARICRKYNLLLQNVIMIVIILHTYYVYVLLLIRGLSTHLYLSQFHRNNFILYLYSKWYNKTNIYTESVLFTVRKYIITIIYHTSNIYIYTCSIVSGAFYCFFFFVDIRKINFCYFRRSRLDIEKWNWKGSFS